MSTLDAARQLVLEQLATASISAVTDPRQARPGGVYVDIPTITRLYNAYRVEVEIPVHVLGVAPAGDLTAVAMFELVDDVLAAVDLVTTGAPTTITIGQAEYPCYTLTAQISLERS